MNDSPQVAAARVLQAALNNSPSAQAMRAMQRMANSGAQQNPVQRKIQPVTEQVIVAEKQRNPDLDEDYFDGLYYDSQYDRTGATYVYAGTVAESLLKEGGRAEKGVPLYVLAENTTEGAIDALLLLDELSTLLFVSEDEQIRVTGKQIIAAAKKAGLNGAHIFQRLLVGAMDAEPKGGAGGEFGNIEFRFEKTMGCLYTSLGAEVVSDESILAKWKDGLEVRRISQEELEHYIAIYRALELPYPEERIGGDYLFVSEAFVDELDEYDSPEDAAEFDPVSHFDILSEANGGQPPLPAPAGSKSKEKTYVRTAVRGDRGTGQKAAMNNISARQYADFFTGNRAGNIGDWEWLHLQGSRLGGKNERGNLVAGTASANSHMIPMEREILALSRDSDDQHPVEVHWTATLKRVDDELTHIGDKISISVSAENGTKSNATPRAFSKVFDATEGETFSKFDRDSAHLQSQENGGRGG